jgi:hypothetical protein
MENLAQRGNALAAPMMAGAYNAAFDVSRVTAVDVGST